LHFELSYAIQVKTGLKELTRRRMHGIVSRSNNERQAKESKKSGNVTQASADHSFQPVEQATEAAIP
jgi:hypothetical protein